MSPDSKYPLEGLVMKKLETVLVLNPNSMVVVEEIPLELLAFVPRVEETLSTNKGHYCIAEVG